MSSPTNLPLSEMSHAAKLRLMEELWDDLCHSLDSGSSPSWHGKILAARAERVKNGEAHFREWSDVKAGLLREKTKSTFVL